MKTLHASAVILLLLFVTGCKSPGVVHVSGNDYMLSRASYAGMFANMPALKAQVVREANMFAELRGKVAIPVRSAESRPSAGFPSFDYWFRLEDPTNTVVKVVQ